MLFLTMSENLPENFLAMVPNRMRFWSFDENYFSQFSLPFSCLYALFSVLACRWDYMKWLWIKIDLMVSYLVKMIPLPSINVLYIITALGTLLANRINIEVMIMYVKVPNRGALHNWFSQSCYLANWGVNLKIRVSC